MNLHKYIDPNEMPTEIFKKFLIPLSYEDTLRHCRAYYISNRINICNDMLFWEDKINNIPENEKIDKLFQAVKNNQVIYIKLLVNDGYIYDNIINDAALTCDESMIKFLIANTNIDPSFQYQSPLRRAVDVGNISAVKGLLSDSRVTPYEKKRYSPLQIARHEKNYEILKIFFLWMCKNMDMDGYDLYRYFMKSVKNLLDLEGHYSIENIIIANPKQTINVGLKIACYYNNYVTVETLLKYKLADKRSQNNYCEMIATQRNDTRMLKILNRF